MVKQKNRWAIFIGAWIITFCNASSAIFSVFSKPMTELNGWTMTDFTGLGWFLAGSCTTITTLYLTFGVMAGVGCGLLYNAGIEMTFRVLGIMFFVAIAAVGAMVTLLMVIKEKKAKGE